MLIKKRCLYKGALYLTFTCHLQRSSPRPLEIETCPETSVRNYPPTLHKIPKQPISRNLPLSRHRAWRFNRIESLDQNGISRDFCSVTNSDIRDAMYFKSHEPTGIRNMHARSELKAYGLWPHAHRGPWIGAQNVAVGCTVGTFYRTVLLPSEESISDSSSIEQYYYQAKSQYPIVAL